MTHHPTRSSLPSNHDRNKEPFHMYSKFFAHYPLSCLLNLISPHRLDSSVSVVVQVRTVRPENSVSVSEHCDAYLSIISAPRPGSPPHRVNNSEDGPAWRYPCRDTL